MRIGIIKVNFALSEDNYTIHKHTNQQIPIVFPLSLMHYQIEKFSVYVTDFQYQYPVHIANLF